MKILPPNYLWINYCLLTGMMIPLSLNTVPFWLGPFNETVWPVYYFERAVFVFNLSKNRE